MGACGDRETRIFLKVHAWGIRPLFREISTGRPKFPGKVQILPPKTRETRIFLHFLRLCRPKFPGISWRVTPKCRENLEFSWKFPGKNLSFSSSIPGNPYILAFLDLPSTKIPGNSWKCRPPIFVKIRNFDKNFPGKFWLSAWEFRDTRIFLHFWEFCRPKFLGIRENIDPRFSWKFKIRVDTFRGKVCILSRECRETRIFLHFCTSWWHKFPGILVEVWLISGRFDENCEFWKIRNFQEIIIFLEATFFVKSDILHFVMSFIIVWTGWYVYKKHILLTTDEYRHRLTKMGCWDHTFLKISRSRESRKFGEFVKCEVWTLVTKHCGLPWISRNKVFYHPWTLLIKRWHESHTRATRAIYFRKFVFCENWGLWCNAENCGGKDFFTTPKKCCYLRVSRVYTDCYTTHCDRLEICLHDTGRRSHRQIWGSTFSKFPRI